MSAGRMVGRAPQRTGADAAPVPVAPLAVLACGLLVLGLGPGVGAYAAQRESGERGNTGHSAGIAQTATATATSAATTAPIDLPHRHHVLIGSAALLLER